MSNDDVHSSQLDSTLRAQGGCEVLGGRAGARRAYPSADDAMSASAFPSTLQTHVVRPGMPDRNAIAVADIPRFFRRHSEKF